MIWLKDFGWGRGAFISWMRKRGRTWRGIGRWGRSIQESWRERWRWIQEVQDRGAGLSCLKMDLGLSLALLWPWTVRMEEAQDPKHQCLGLQPLGCLLESSWELAWNSPHPHSSLREVGWIRAKINTWGGHHSTQHPLLGSAEGWWQARWAQPIWGQMTSSVPSFVATMELYLAHCHLSHPVSRWESSGSQEKPSFSGVKV